MARSVRTCYDAKPPMDSEMLDPTLLVMTVLIFVGPLGLLLWLVRWIERRNRNVADEPGLWTGRNYVCPHCREPMIQGWVLLGKGAIWSDRARGRPGTFALVTNALPNTMSLRFKPAANMAWRCPQCRLLLIDHRHLVH